MENSDKRRKIINDPVYGFIKLKNEFHYELIEHPSFQRMRRIRQLGLTDYVYPGAFHSRFQHSIGAAYLMQEAVDVLRDKGFDISDKEEESAISAILLHDIGHGPFSHALEFSVVEGVNHELMSLLYMDSLNEYFSGRLLMAIEIFTDKYPKRFLHQLVSSQLDVDRLDYLCRDSFFSGVIEGAVGVDRIIRMLTVADGKIAVEAKGIYSIEKFLIARRLMYWQVYLHKTVVAAEEVLIQLLKRVKFLYSCNFDLFLTPSLEFFVKNNSEVIENFRLFSPSLIISNFDLLDDSDIIICAKMWMTSSDKVLSYLAKSLINRNLPKVHLVDKSFDDEYVDEIKNRIVAHFGISASDANFLVTNSMISNKTYSPVLDEIKIVYHNGDIVDVAEASDMLNLSVLSKEVKKYCLCYPRF
ncbi:MAG: HD domain-containing protein [Bacteroidales bacterium]|nr:HD domain-containing protein [Bacteroidales bacterium]